MEKLNNEKIPEFLIQKLNSQYGSELTNIIIDGYFYKRKVTLRVNTIKTTVEEVIKKLEKLNIEFERVKWYKDCLIIKNASENDLRTLELYDNGEIYLQSLSSMIPPIVLAPKENSDILDMAAAPGGKTTQLACLTSNKAHITACEMNTIRLDRLKYNVEKQGAKCVSVMKKDSRQLDDFFAFDNILLDAPCSGSGTLGLNNFNAYQYFTEKLIQKSCASQKALLKKAINVLKKGQEMVYSTCSILEEENESIINEVILNNKAEIVPINIEAFQDIPILPTKIAGTLCVCPTELYEGFFVAKLRKK
ncbi:MAG: RsmB/NOP family class I SAM-dependent RNA methyltransferase [Clostridia bacterium]|nr:RsmB/NOP family class I SAM-dependent RNA methyltransferase [Clostridia bacterium]